MGSSAVYERYHLHMFMTRDFAIVWGIAAFCVIAVIGMVVGGATGVLVSRLAKRDPEGLFWNLLMGAVGGVAGFMGCLLMPWPENTITYQLPGGTIVTETANRFQHPWWVALAAMVLLPLLHELYRLRRMSISEKSALH